MILYGIWLRLLLLLSLFVVSSLSLALSLSHFVSLVTLNKTCLFGAVVLNGSGRVTLANAEPEF